MFTGNSPFKSPPSAIYIRLVIILLSFAVITLQAGCTSTPTKIETITLEPPENTAKPIIKGLVDLGGLEIEVGMAAPRHFSDQRFSPGEWLMLEGKNLGVNHVTIDGVDVAVKYFVGKNPLLRLPTGLKPLQQHELVVKNSFGTSSIPFNSSHYIVSTDTDGKQIFLIRTNRNEKGGVEEEWVSLPSDSKRPLYTFFSKDSRFLFNVNVHSQAANKSDEDKNFNIEITTYHVAAPNKPEEIASQTFTLGSSPIDALINNDNTILLLGKSSLTLIDASQPASLQWLSDVDLPKNDDGWTAYIDAVYFNHNDSIAVLETYSNRIVLLDVSNPKTLHIQDQLSLLPENAIPLSVDLEPDPSNPNTIWALIGPNYRLAGGKIVDLYKRYITKEDQNPDGDTTVEHKLLSINLSPKGLSVERSIATPNDYATFFGTFGEDGRMYISATKMDFFNTYYDRYSDDSNLKKVGKMIWNSISFGRIVALDIETGDIEDVAEGVGIYYHLVDVPDIGPVFSLMKFGPSFSFPYLKPVWGMGISSTGTYSKRKLNKYAVFPPYSLGHVDFQY